MLLKEQAIMGMWTTWCGPPLRLSTYIGGGGSASHTHSRARRDGMALARSPSPPSTGGGR